MSEPSRSDYLPNRAGDVAYRQARDEWTIDSLRADLQCAEEEIERLRRANSELHRRAQKAEGAVSSMATKTGGSWSSPDRQRQAADSDRMMKAVQSAEESTK